MPKSSISFKVINLVNDPLKISLWFEIQRNPGITAKELNEKLKLKGTNIYYHLNQLEDNKLIVSESKQVEKSNLLEKEYSINLDYFASEEWQARMEIGKSQKHLKEIILHNLYLNIFLTNKLIMDIQGQSNEQIKERIEQGEYMFSKYIFLQKDDLPAIKEEFVKMMDTLNKVKREADKDPKLDISEATMGLLLSLLPLE